MELSYVAAFYAHGVRRLSSIHIFFCRHQRLLLLTKIQENTRVGCSLYLLSLHLTVCCSFFTVGVFYTARFLSLYVLNFVLQFVLFRGFSVPFNVRNYSHRVHFGLNFSLPLYLYIRESYLRSASQCNGFRLIIEILCTKFALR